MDIRRIVPDVVQRILAVGGEDVFSISLVFTGAEPYFLVDVSGDNAATMIARRLWPDLPEKEGMYFLTIEGRIPIWEEDGENDEIAIVVTVDSLHILMRDIEGDDVTYIRVYRSEEARVPDHEVLADGLEAVARAFESERSLIPGVASALATAPSAIVQWWGDRILRDALDENRMGWSDALKRIVAHLKDVSY